jgi:hypothetical protein
VTRSRCSPNKSSAAKAHAVAPALGCQAVGGRPRRALLVCRAGLHSQQVARVQAATHSAGMPAAARTAAQRLQVGLQMIQQRFSRTKLTCVTMLTALTPCSRQHAPHLRRLSHPHPRQQGHRLPPAHVRLSLLTGREPVATNSRLAVRGLATPTSTAWQHSVRRRTHHGWLRLEVCIFGLCCQRCCGWLGVRLELLRDEGRALHLRTLQRSLAWFNGLLTSRGSLSIWLLQPQPRQQGQEDQVRDMQRLFLEGQAYVVLIPQGLLIV